MDALRDPLLPMDGSAHESIVSGNKTNNRTFKKVFLAMYCLGGLASGAVAALYYNKINASSSPIFSYSSSVVNAELFTSFSVKRAWDLQNRFIDFWQALWKLDRYYWPMQWGGKIILAAIKFCLISMACILASIPYYATLYLIVTNNGNDPESYTLFWQVINIAFLAANSFLYMSDTYKFVDRINIPKNYRDLPVAYNWIKNCLCCKLTINPERLILSTCVLVAFVTSVAEWYATSCCLLSASAQDNLILPSILKMALSNLYVAFFANSTTFIFSFYNAIIGNFDLTYNKLSAALGCPKSDSGQSDDFKIDLLPSWMDDLNKKREDYVKKVISFMTPADASKSFETYCSRAIKFIDFIALLVIAGLSIATLFNITKSCADDIHSGDNWYTKSLTPQLAKVLGYLAAIGAGGVNGSSIANSMTYNIVCGAASSLMIILFRLVSCFSCPSRGYTAVDSDDDTCSVDSSGTSGVSLKGGRPGGSNRSDPFKYVKNQAATSGADAVAPV